MLAKLNFPLGMHHDYYHYLCSTVLKVSMEGPLMRLRCGLNENEQPEVFETAVDALDAELDLLDQHVEEVRSALNRA